MVQATHTQKGRVTVYTLPSCTSEHMCSILAEDDEFDEEEHGADEEGELDDGFQDEE